MFWGKQEICKPPWGRIKADFFRWAPRESDRWGWCISARKRETQHEACALLYEGDRRRGPSITLQATAKNTVWQGFWHRNRKLQGSEALHKPWESVMGAARGWKPANTDVRLVGVWAGDRKPTKCQPIYCSAWQWLLSVSSTDTVHCVCLCLRVGGATQGCFWPVSVPQGLCWPANCWNNLRLTHRLLMTNESWVDPCRASHSTISHARLCYQSLLSQWSGGCSCSAGQSEAVISKTAWSLVGNLHRSACLLRGD